MGLQDHGLVSSGFTQAYDTLKIRSRHLDLTGRDHSPRSASTQSSPRFVKAEFFPSGGISSDTKLHTNTCNTGGLTYSFADPMRWSG